MIKTDKETEQYLKLLGKNTYSQPEDPGFSALVWTKVQNPVPPVLTWKPAFALTALSAVLILLFWTYYQPAPVSRETVSESISIVGAVLETSPNLANTLKPIVEEGDFLTTGPEGEMTFFLPGAGYFHLRQDSKVEIKKARHDSKTGGFQYELFLEEGALYSRLAKLDRGSALNYLTPHGQASVLGTDFLLNVKKDSGTAIQVLNGVVKVASRNHSEERKDVQSGFSALISPNTSGKLLVTELEGARLAELTEEFTEIFKGSHEESKRNGTANFRIVSHREMKWKK